MKKYSWLFVLVFCIQAANAQSIGAPGAAIGFPSSGSGGSGGSGTVNNGTGGTLGYYAATGTAISPLTLGTNLSITGSTLNSNAGITTGDGTVENTSPTSGALTLVNAPPYNILGNPTGTSATPIYFPGGYGIQTLTSNTVLTANSPSRNILNGSSNSVTVTLPAASTCSPGQPFYFQCVNGTHSCSVALNAADTYLNLSAGGNYLLQVTGNATTTSYTTGLAANPTTNSWMPILPPYISLAGIASTGTGNGAIVIQSSGSTLGETFTPGSIVTLTSVTATHQIGGGTPPTVALGAGAGSGGSVGVTIAGHDTDFAVTLVTGTTTTPAAGTLFTVTFGTAYATAPYPQMTNFNGNAALTGAGTLIGNVYPTTTTTTLVATATAGLTANATYIWSFHCGQ